MGYIERLIGAHLDWLERDIAESERAMEEWADQLVERMKEVFTSATHEEILYAAEWIADTKGTDVDTALLTADSAISTAKLWANAAVDAPCPESDSIIWLAAIMLDEGFESDLEKMEKW